MFALGNKMINKLSFGYQYIYKATYHSRLSHYLNQLKEGGYFNYALNLKIFNNGDVHFKDNFTCNLIKVNNEGLISYGIRTKAFLGSNSSSKPYHFKIHNQKGNSLFLLGFKSNMNIEFSVSTDNDVFDELIYSRLFKQGMIIKDLKVYLNLSTQDYFRKIVPVKVSLVNFLRLSYCYVLYQSYAHGLT